MRNDINLRTEFDEFMEDYGFYVLILRAGRKLRCRCWNEKHQEANSKCPLCLGNGYVSRIERHRVRRVSAVQTISRVDLNQQTPVGKMWVDAQTFYTRYDAHPKVGDFIYEVGWEGQKPTHLIQSYKVNDVVSMRGDNGRIEFWNAATKADTLDKAFKNIVVRSIGSLKNYEFVT